MVSEQDLHETNIPMQTDEELIPTKQLVTSGFLLGRRVRFFKGVSSGRWAMFPRMIHALEYLVSTESREAEGRPVESGGEQG